jgi:CelD/BcsL family acetyltransferase involved in cellulose biosynthesis
MSIGSVPAPVLDVVRSDTDFAALGPEWDEFVASARHGSVFSTWAWLSAWRRTVGADDRLLLVTARDPQDGRLLGAAPLSITPTRRGGIPHRVLRFAGSGPAAPDHLDLLLRRGHERIAATLWTTVRRSAGWDLADLDGLRAGAHLARAALRRDGDDRHIVAVDRCPYVALPTTWEAFEATLGKNHRQNIRRYARKMDREASGAVVERMVTRSDEVAETIDRLIDLHQSIRTGKGDRGSFASPPMRAFAHAAAEELFEAGRLRLHRLDVAGDAVAVIWCMRHAGVVSFYSTGYDEAWSHYGPGRRVMASAIRSAIDEGATEFDFLRGDEAYKNAWTDRSRLNQRVVVPHSRRGRALWTLRNVKAAVRGGA